MLRWLRKILWGEENDDTVRIIHGTYYSTLGMDVLFIAYDGTVILCDSGSEDAVHLDQVQQERRYFISEGKLEIRKDGKDSSN